MGFYIKQPDVTLVSATQMNKLYVVHKTILSVLTYFVAQSDSRIYYFIIILFHEDSQYTGVWKYCGVYKILRCLSKNRLFTKML